MLLALNVGNSDITLGIFEKDTLVLKTVISTHENYSADEYAVAITSLLSLHGFNKKLIDGAIISCVVPALTGVVKKALGYIYSGKIFVVGPGIKTGLKIKADNPGQVGTGLVCQSVAILEKYTVPALLISMGTALSMFVLDKDGTFIGGSILPGIKLSAIALSRHTAQLPQVDTSQKVKGVIGTTSAQNIQSGIIFGTACTINGMIDLFEKELGSSLTCVATGEFTNEILKHCKNTIIYDENLVLDGLRIIYEKNVK